MGFAPTAVVLRCAKSSLVVALSLIFRYFVHRYSAGKMTFGNQEKLGMIVVMGVTGAGKSYLINKLAGRAIVDEGATLDPCK